MMQILLMVKKLYFSQDNKKNQKKLLKLRRSHSLIELKPFIMIPTIFLEVADDLQLGLVIHRLHVCQIILAQGVNKSSTDRVSQNVDSSTESEYNQLININY